MEINVQKCKKIDFKIKGYNTKQYYIEMIIPVRCFTCGMVIGDKYRFYTEEVRKKKLIKNKNCDTVDLNKVLYLTKELRDKTPEGEVLDMLKMTKMCCRRHFLTHVDID